MQFLFFIAASYLVIEYINYVNRKEKRDGLEDTKTKSEAIESNREEDKSQGIRIEVNNKSSDDNSNTKKEVWQEEEIQCFIDDAKVSIKECDGESRGECDEDSIEDESTEIRIEELDEEELY